MKITDELIRRIGADKLLHFCVAGWLVSMAGYLGITFAIITSVLVIVVSVLKELYFDKEADWNDLVAALFGMTLSWILLF